MAERPFSAALGATTGPGSRECAITVCFEPARLSILAPKIVDRPTVKERRFSAASKRLPLGASQFAEKHRLQSKVRPSNQLFLLPSSFYCSVSVWPAEPNAERAHVRAACSRVIRTKL